MPDLDTSSFEALEMSGWRDRDTAQSYADGFAEAAAQAVPATCRAIGRIAGRRVLDLCTGHGIVAEALAAEGAQVTGLDFSAAMLDMAKARVPTATFVEGDALDLPFEDGGFDAVTMGFGMLHMPDPDRALAEIHRVLRPGGVFAFSVWHNPSIPTSVGYVMGAIMTHGDPDIALPPGPGQFDFATAEAADDRLTAAGFGEISRVVVDSYWQIDRPDQPVDFFMDGTVRGGALLRRQSPEAMSRIRAAVSAQITGTLGETGPWRAPVPAVVTRVRAL